MSSQSLFVLALFLAIAGGALALILNRSARAAALVSGLSAFAAALVGLVCGLQVMLSGQGFEIQLASGFSFASFVLHVDPLSAFMVVVICFLSGAVGLYSIGYLEEYREKSPGVLGGLINWFIASMLLVVTSWNAFYFLIFWEVMTLTSYFLVVYEQDKPSLRAGFLYFLVAHGGTALIMLAFLLLYSQAGSFDFADFHGLALTPGLASLIFVFAFIGFAAKAGAVPLHFWLPEAHSAAPSNVSALLSGVMIKTAIFMIVRVCVEFLGAGTWWWGFTVLLVGVISTVLGPIYALTQHDIKRLLAFHSVEYIGIILMGVGAGMLGMALNQPVVAAIGLMAAFYHLLNHAVFKGLLFLGAGSVIYRTHTRNMEELGGLAKLMPWTSVLFLIGGVAISAVPPLNGFVSKWFIYQSLFGLSINGGVLDRALAPLFAALLAMAGASTAMCIVKAYGVTFLGPARTAHAEHAREVPSSMIWGKGILALGSVLFGLGAALIAPQIGAAVTAVIQGPALTLAAGTQVFPGNAAQAVLDLPVVALILALLLLVPMIVVAVFGGAKAGRRADATPWAAGYRYSAPMAVAPRSFGQPIQTLFHWLHLPNVTFNEHDHRFGASSPKYFRQISFKAGLEDVWQRFLLNPISQAVEWASNRIQVLQSGNLRLYVLYIIVMLAALLAAVELVK
jgi:hydrogenase-4 component B